MLRQLTSLSAILRRMRSPVFILAGALLYSTSAVAQSPYCASLRNTDKDVILAADSWDPVLAISDTLADRYGISVSVESPQWAFPNDTEDVAIADPQFSAQHRNIHYLVMKRHVVQVRFPAVADAHPKDLVGLLVQLRDAANKEMPYAYRLDAHDREYVLVPTKTRNSAGELEDVQPLLDRHVNIPAGSRSLAEHASLMADQLSGQTGLHVNCCQSFVGGIPWGRAAVLFQADDEPAREVLRRLIRLEEQQNSHAPNWHPAYDHWRVGCDGTGAPWCFIEVRGIFSTECR